MNSRYSICPHAQGTPEWLADRLGRVTGSPAANLYAKIKEGEAAARRDYRYKLALERLTGRDDSDHFISKDMQWGLDNEPLARMAFEAESGEVVQEFGFLLMHDFAAGCSVDGLILGEKVGVWECKCPKSATHIGYIEEGVLPKTYVPQLTHNVWVTDAAFGIFTSFDPRLPEDLQLFTVRVERSELDVAGHEQKVIQFLKEVDDLETKLRNLRRK